MSRRARDDVPLGVEIIDLEGNVVAAGTAMEPEPEPGLEPGRGRNMRPWFVGAAMVALVAVAATLLFGSDSTDRAAGDPLPILTGPELQLGGQIADATFPLLGRQWDHELLYAFNSGVRAIDLNSGAERLIGSVGRGSDIQTIGVVDHDVYAAGFRGIYELTDGESRLLTPPFETDTISGWWLLGNYWYERVLFTESLVLTNLHTGIEIELDAIIEYTAAGDHVFFEKGGAIGTIDGSGTSSEWARGELLAVGPTRVAWRECESTNQCTYWTGTVDEPRERQLDSKAAETGLIVGLGGAGGGTGFLKRSRPPVAIGPLRMDGQRQHPPDSHRGARRIRSLRVPPQLSRSPHTVDSVSVAACRFSNRRRRFPCSLRSRPMSPGPP